MDTESYEAKYDAWSALGAAYDALGMSIGAPPFYKLHDIEKNEFVLGDNDAAGGAVIAYSVVDDSKPGAWREKYFGREEWIFDLERRLEFWEWWLTEAVPSAWEIAQQSE